MKRNPWKLNALDIPMRNDEEYENFYHDVIARVETIKKESEE